MKKHSDFLWATPQFQEAIQSVLKSEKKLSSAAYGFVIIDRSTGEIISESFHHADHENIYPGSSIKTLIAFATFKKIDSGQWALECILEGYSVFSQNR